MKESKQRETLEELQERLDSPFRMCWGFMTKEAVYMDIPRKGAASMYRSNFEGCRELWKANYRQRRGLP